MWAEKTAADHIAEWLLNDEGMHKEAVSRARQSLLGLRDWALHVMWNASPDSHAGWIAERYSRRELLWADWQQVREWLLAE